MPLGNSLSSSLAARHIYKRGSVTYLLMIQTKRRASKANNFLNSLLQYLVSNNY